MNEEPVNIDILLRQNVDEEADKASRSMDKMAESSDEVWKHSQEALKLQQEVIARLKKELSDLQEAFKAVNIGTNDPKLLSEREKQSQAIHAVMSELKGEEDALKEMMSASDKAGQKAKSLETRMREVREELSAMSMAGKKDTDEYRAKEQQLGTLATAYREVYQTQLQLSKGGASLQGIVSGLSALSGLFSAGAGALGLFNTNSDAYNKIQTKMQSLMAITIGLQQVQQTLYQTSAFRIQTVTRAKQLWTTTTNRLTVALGISNVAAKALMGTLTLGLSVAIGAAIAVIDKLVSRHKEAREEANKFNESVAQNSAEQIANYENLRTSYNALGNDVKAKEKFILDNQNAFNQLGVSINSVNDADNLFIGQTEAFKNSILQRAKAAASMEMASEKYKEALTKYSEADKREQEPSKWEKATSSNDFYDRNGQNVLLNKKAVQAADKIREKGEELEKEAQNYVNQSIVFNNNASESLKNASIEAAGKIETGTKAWWEAQKKNAQARLDAMKESEIGSAEWEKNVQEINKADDALKKFDIKTVKTNDTNKDKDKDKEEKARANEKLKKLEVDIQQDIDAAVVAAMQEGKEKKLKELENDYNQRMQIISEREEELKDIEKKGIDVTKQKDQLDKLKKSEQDKYDKSVTAVETGAGDAINDVMNEINARFSTQSKMRLDDIDRFYAEQTKKAKENGATQAQLDEIELNHKKDTELEKHNIAIETLDFETQIALRKAEIENRNVFLESDRQEKILKIQIAAAKKRLEELENEKATGQGVEQQIEDTSTAIDEMSGKLEETKTDKIKEIGQVASQALTSIGNFAGVFDEDLTSLFDVFSGLTEGIANIASGDPKAMVQGATQLLDVVGKIFKMNKDANAEIKKFNYDLAQQAINYSLAVIKAIKDVKSETDSIFSDNYTNTLTQGMTGYNAAIEKQSELMKQLSSETVKTGVEKKKFLGITYGTKDVYSSLLKTYPDLINKDGTLNRELAESLQKSGVLKEDTSTLIDNILSASDAADEAMQSVESAMQNLVGSIGEELKTALDDAFASGTDSAKAMTDNVVKLLKDISTQKLYNAVFGSLFAQLEDKMKESYGATGDKDLTDDIDWFMQNYPDLVDSYNKGLAELQTAIQERYGTDAFTAENGRTTVNKGIAQASQDSIDELNGRLTFLVMKVSDIGTVSSEHLNTGVEQLAVMKAMLSQLDVMTENSEFLRHLSYIRDDISKVVRDGINLKS